MLSTDYTGSQGVLYNMQSSETISNSLVYTPPRTTHLAAGRACFNAIMPQSAFLDHMSCGLFTDAYNHYRIGKYLTANMTFRHLSSFTHQTIMFPIYGQARTLIFNLYMSFLVSCIHPPFAA